MKKYYLLVLAIVISLSVLGCAAHVRLGNDENGIKINHASGYATPERGIRILEDQSYFQERQEILAIKKKLYQRISGAIDSLDQEEIDRINSILVALENSSVSDKVRYLGIRNDDPKYAIRIKNGPFEGLYLNPGERTHTKKPFIVGTFPLEYEWYRVGTNSKGKNLIYVSVGEYRSEDIVFKHWDN
jgi:hypothetical protein